jgi:hypothetical protein
VTTVLPGHDFSQTARLVCHPERSEGSAVRMERLYYVNILASAAKLVRLLAAESLFSESSHRL